jgi:CMP/dCMP kinase
VIAGERGAVTPTHRVIAIDGPAASGKSSVARELARRLGFAYVNSGAMYRAITWHVLEKGIDPNDNDRIVQLVQTATIHCELKNRQSRILINGLDPAAHLREDRVNNEVSQVSTVPQVRQILVEKMRDYAHCDDLVTEGRDIGSVVFPDTPYKFYIDASPEVRLRRRAAEGQRDQIAARDRADSLRRASPLIIAEDALVIDSSNLTIDGVVGEIIGRLKNKGLKVPDSPPG